MLTRPKYCFDFLTPKQYWTPQKRFKTKKIDPYKILEGKKLGAKKYFYLNILDPKNVCNKKFGALRIFLTQIFFTVSPCRDFTKYISNKKFYNRCQ